MTGTTAAPCPHALSWHKHKPLSLQWQPCLTPITSLWMTRPSLCRGKHNFLGYPTQPCCLSWKGTRKTTDPYPLPHPDYECVKRVNYPVRATAPVCPLQSSPLDYRPSTAVMVLLTSSVVAFMQHTDHISRTSFSPFSANLARRRQIQSSQRSPLHPYGHQCYGHGDAQTLPAALSVALTAVAYVFLFDLEKT